MKNTLIAKVLFAIAVLVFLLATFSVPVGTIPLIPLGLALAAGGLFFS